MKKSMKWVLAGAVVLSLIGVACKKEEAYVGVPVQEVSTVYDLKDVQSYTIDGDGNLYCFQVEFDMENGTSEARLTKWDKKGNSVFSRPFDSEKSSGLSAMTIQDNLLYFVADGFDGKDVCSFLYTYDLDSSEITFLQSFRYLKRVDRIFVNKNRVYLLGRNRVTSAGGTSDSYSYNGERVLWCSLDTKDVFELGFGEPIDMAMREDGTPVFYIHEEDGFSFVSYNEKSDTVETLAKTPEYKMNCFTLCEDEESILYHTERGLVLSKLSELGVESELYPDTNFWDKGLCYVNGSVACRGWNHELVQFPLEQVKKETETIRYLSVGFETQTPYGCGYRIDRRDFSETEMDKFALKILAQDSDYDLCMVDTSDSISYNLKENGVFYPLNDVPGIEAYLDACFPYVREAATDEDGLIWMLPIEVNIPGFVMDADQVSKFGFTDQMTFEAYFRAQAALPEEERNQTDTPWVAFLNHFFYQYFGKNDTVDTVVFRDTVKLFSEYMDCISGYSARGDGSPAIYHCATRADSYGAYYITEFAKNKVVYSWPKVTGEEKNSGTCLFLAVNPESDRLEETLQYLGDLIAYTGKQSEQPLFFADRPVGEDTYEQSLYALYQNGEISFAIEEEITDGYEDVLADVTKLDAYITETDRKLKVYLRE
ncbi:MAG: hypothetical protein J6J38_03965 [Lachnospiraceae bacterium]|nr:hypothetical protein [Lachnospiraceae bacterium]